MMRKISLFLISVSLLGCASPLRESAEDQGYTKLFSNSEKCMAAFQRNGMLYIQNKLLVTVYDPNTGAFASLSGKKGADGWGKSACFFDARIPWGDYPWYEDTDKTGKELKVSVLISPSFKRIFDNAALNPKVLEGSLTAGPVYFRHDGKWEGKDTAITLQETIHARTIPDIANALGELDSQKVAASITGHFAAIENAKARREAWRDREMQQAQQDQERRESQKKLARREWSRNSQGSLSKGDRVCTFETNLFGNVEAVEGSKVKVFLIGKVHGQAGYFFSNSGTQFRFDRVESYRWLERTELARCYFDEYF